MKNLLLASLFFIIGISFFFSQGFAEDKNTAWESEFVQALRKEKARIETDEGLSYASAGETVLAEAIRQAIVINNAPACPVMKIAIDLEFNPYLVIKNIFSHGGEIDMNQLYMCATKYGINKQIFIKASKDAVTPLGKPVFPMIVQSPPNSRQFTKSSPTWNISFY